MSTIDNIVEKAKEVPTYKYIIAALCVVVFLLLSSLLSRNKKIVISCPECKPCKEFRSNKSKEVEEAFSNNGQASITCYYTNWCGHSRMFLPEWDKFNEYGKDNLKNIKISKVDCDENSDVCAQKQVSGFPMVILVKPDGSSVKYDRERTVDELIKFCNEYTK